MCTPAVPPVGVFDNFAEIDVSDLFPGKTLRNSVVAQINSNILEGTFSPEIFAPVTKTNGQTVALPTSAVDGYVYKREELQYLWWWANTGPESSGIRLPLCRADVDQTTGLVTIVVWRLPGGHPPVLSNDGSIVVVVVGSRERQHPAISATSEAPPDDMKPADEIKGSIVLSTQSAGISGHALFTVPVGRAGLYRITFRAKVTVAATTSSTLGGANGFQVSYTDDTDGNAATTPATPGNTGNTLGTPLSGAVIINIRDNTAVTFDFGYATGGATAMKYELTVAWDEVIPTGGPTIAGVTYKWLGNYTTNF